MNKILHDIDFKDGNIIFDDFAINFFFPLLGQELTLKEDLLQVDYGNYLLDIGWYPEFEINGKFIIQIISNFNWEKPIVKTKTKNLKSLKKAIKKAVDIIESLKNKDFSKAEYM